jgi:competence protein ComEC
VQDVCPERSGRDVPAALPLIAYVAALVCGGSPRDAIGLFAVVLLLAASKRARAAVICAAAAAGITASLVQSRAPRPEISDSRFVRIEAPIDRDWMLRGDAYVLRVPQFNDFGEPLAIYARFEPKPIAMQTSIRVEGFLRRNDRGDLTVTVKSPRLLSYEGTLSALRPAAWNRVFANRLRPLATSHPTEVALVEALALGRGERLADEVRDQYKRGGTYHLLVFSGLQIAFAAGVIALLLRSFHAPRTSDWSLLAFAVVAPMFIGPTASVSRASLGIGLYAISRILKRPTTLENLWCVAALARLIVAPRDLTDAGFQLTFAGAGALLFIGKPLARGRVRWIAYAAGAECAVTPLTLFHFHQYALGGSIATLLLTPVVFAMLIVSAFVCAVPAAPLLQLIGLLHRLCTIINDCASPLSGFYAAPPPRMLACGLLLALIAIAALRGRARAAALVAAFLIPSIASIIVAHRDVTRPTLTVLDVGQGDAIVLRTPEHAILIDGGCSYADVVSLLVDRGVRRLDALFLTHIHPDHCGGLPDVVRRLDVRQMWISPRRFSGDCAQRLLEAASARGVPIHLVRDGDTLVTGGIFFRALLAGRTFKHAAENNASTVLRAAIGRTTILLTGDIERDAEESLLARTRRADILKVAHHGSRSSTTPAFLDLVSPRIALISCGRHNLFGHPHREVVDRLRDAGVRVYRTDLDGCIDVRIERGSLLVSESWMLPPAARSSPN